MSETNHSAGAEIYLFSRFKNELKGLSNTEAIQLTRAELTSKGITDTERLDAIEQVLRLISDPGATREVVKGQLDLLHLNESASKVVTMFLEVMAPSLVPQPDTSTLSTARARTAGAPDRKAA